MFRIWNTLTQQSRASRLVKRWGPHIRLRISSWQLFAARLYKCLILIHASKRLDIMVWNHMLRWSARRTPRSIKMFETFHAESVALSIVSKFQSSCHVHVQAADEIDSLTNLKDECFDCIHNRLDLHYTVWYLSNIPGPPHELRQADSVFDAAPLCNRRIYPGYVVGCKMGSNTSDAPQRKRDT